MGLGGAVQVASLYGRLSLDDQMTPGLQRATGEAQRLAGGLGDTLKTAALGISGALAGIGMASIKAAIDWESAFAGVLKTVDGTPEDLAAIEQGLRDMATGPVLGALSDAHTQLAGIAEAAGQLGVDTGDILGFTQTMAMLGIATNLTAQSAAFMTAQFQNITQMDPADVDNFGAALVALGNNAATTEKDILEMATRLAGAGTMAGLTQADILGLATAMSSVGLNAEAGGTAMTEVMTTITTAVANGGPALEEFARIAGTSATSFADTWRADPIAALNEFITGLGGLSAEEQIAALDNLGLSGIRTSDTLRRLSGDQELLNEMIVLANGAWEENTALVEEAEKRAGTTDSQINIFKNSLNDLGITIGDALLPSVNNLITGLTGIIDQIKTAAEAGDSIAVLQTIFDGLGTALTDIVTGIADFVGPVVANLLGVDWAGAEAGVQQFFGTIEALWILIKDQLGAAISGLTTTIAGWWNSIKGGVEAFASGIMSTLQPVIDFINGIASSINSVLTSLGLVQGAPVSEEEMKRQANRQAIANFQPLPYPEAGFASGGFAQAGHAYVVGERGPELFVPGVSGTVIPNGTTGQTIIIQAVYVQDEDPQRWLDRLSDAARLRGGRLALNGAR